MSILIKGVEMPRSCFGCPFMYARRFCSCNPEIEFTDDEYSELKGRYDGCPLVEVPTPHGRLIDADALEELVIKQKYACAGASAYGAITELHKSWGLHDAELMIEAAPTIIPAEEDNQ